MIDGLTRVLQGLVQMPLFRAGLVLCLLAWVWG